MNKTQLLTALTLGMFLMINPAQAQMHDGHDHEHKGSVMQEEHMDHNESDQHHEEGQQELIEVGNKICPVSGQKVGEMGDIVQVEYNGKMYNLCCSMCAKDFKKNPEKYSAIAESEMVGEEVEDVDQATHGHHDHQH